MAKHFRMEEEHLFPSLVAAGGPSGPVQMMRMEHAQMNTLIEQMAVALTHQDAQGYGGLSETLLMAMQQHNLKEEQILYPIADNVLPTERDSLLEPHAESLIATPKESSMEIDVRGLPPPEPFEHIMRALQSLPARAPLKVCIRPRTLPALRSAAQHRLHMADHRA